jgi:hypothetical protein
MKGLEEMTNVYGTPEKVNMKSMLFQIAVAALAEQGWKVERVPGSGKSSVRRITKSGQSKIVSIRTSQDTWIAFPRTEGDKSWRTLDEVDAVVPVSVDDRDAPRYAKVHLIDGNEVRDRFNRAYEARKNAGHSIPIGRGVWVSLYNPEANEPVSHIGAGMGLKFPPIATVPLSSARMPAANMADSGDTEDSLGGEVPSVEAPLSIAEAKRRLALTLGVDPANIKITVEA